MLALARIEHLIADPDGSYRLIFEDGDLGKVLSITREQHDALAGASMVEPFVIQHDGARLISIERYKDEPLRKDWDEPLSADKPFRCAWCRKPCAARTDGLCDECHRECPRETATREESERDTREQVEISREGAA